MTDLPWSEQAIAHATGKKAFLFDEIASTNPIAKTKPLGSIVVATRQTGGYGRRKRAFSSEEGGVYFSCKVAPELDVACINLLTLAAGVAVARAVNGYGVSARLKYPNDVWVDGKKLCGILTECTIADGAVQSAVIGIGINVENRLPEELRDIATSLKACTDVVPSRVQVISDVCRELDALLNEPSVIAPAYREYDGLVGREIVLTTDEGQKVAVYDGIDCNGVMYALCDGERRAVTVGEVTVRPVTK